MRCALLRPALVLILGVLTTVASALAIAVWMPFDVYPRHRAYHFIADGRAWSVVERTQRGVHHLWWGELNADSMLPPPPPEQLFRDSLRTLVGVPPEIPDDGRPTTAQGWIDLNRRSIEENNAIPNNPRKLALPRGSPAWGTFAAGGAPERTVAAGSDHGFGWPLPALWYRVHGVYFRLYAFGTEIRGGRLLTGEDSLELRAYSFRALPYFVYWPGLRGNSALFAGLWAVLLFGPGTARRRLRRQRGACSACGYDLRDSSAERCPECGQELTGSRPPCEPAAPSCPP